MTDGVLFSINGGSTCIALKIHDSILSDVIWCYQYLESNLVYLNH